MRKSRCLVLAIFFFFSFGTMTSQAQTESKILTGDGNEALQNSQHRRHVIDFEGIAPGTLVDEVYSNRGYGPVQVLGRGRIGSGKGDNRAVIFDTRCPETWCSGKNQDFGTPNESFGGPGVGAGGEAGQPFANDTALGNVLIVNKDAVDGFEENPTVSQSLANKIFYFPEPVTIYSLTLLDLDDNETVIIRMFADDEQTIKLATFRDFSTGNNGKIVVQTDSGEPGSGTSGVTNFYVLKGGSNAIDNIAFSPVNSSNNAASISFEADHAIKDELLVRDEGPLTFSLMDAYPNPFNPVTTIRFAVAESSPVKLIVYDILGREIKRLAEGVREAGIHEVTFEAENLPSGTYLYRLETSAGVFSRTMLLLK